jgi:hypothetical protein
MDPLAFCERAGYPPEIREHLARITRALSLRDGESLVLLGSTPRGEFSHIRQAGRFVPLSDYEFLLVTPDLSARSRDLDGLADLERELSGGSPLFHIDVSPIAPAALRRLPPIIRHFETKARGVTLAGPDRLGELPDVRITNLDFRDVNEIPLWRLWSLLLHLPADPAEADAAPRAIFLNYLACRNGLDLTTWMLPWEGELIPSFRERLAFLDAHAARLAWPRCFDGSLLPFLHRCAAGKFENIFDRPWRANHADAARHLLTAASLVRAGTAFPVASGRHGAVSLPDWNFRRKAHEVRALLREGVARSDRGRWLLRKKYSAVSTVLASLHRAWLARHDDGGDGAEELAAARAVLDSIATHSAPGPGSDFVAAWTRERRRLAEFLMFYFPSLGAKRAFVLRTLGEA